MCKNKAQQCSATTEEGVICTHLMMQYFVKYSIGVMALRRKINRI